MAEIKNIYESPYKLQKEQNWQIPDLAAEEKHLSLNSRDTKGKIFSAYQWLVEMYYKMRFDAKTEIAEVRKENILLDKENASLKERVSNLTKQINKPTSTSTKQSTPKSSGVPTLVTVGMVVCGLVLGAVIGVAYLN